MNNKTLFYFVPYKGNFGDQLVPIIVDRMIGRPKYFMGSYKSAPPNEIYMASIGSIMHLLPDNCYVWGTGFNPNYSRVPTGLSVFALRGPRTRIFLNKNGYNLGENEIAYGDPALLFPRLFPEILEQRPIIHDVTFIPHHNDLSYVDELKKKFEPNIVRCDSGVDNLIENIRSSNTVVTSSLHGIILAEVLGKRAVWLELQGSRKSETREKYLDYYESTQRFDIKPALSFHEALSANFGKLVYDDTQLYENFFRCYAA